ncbi:MAG TPA: glycine--tRNA ligase [Candidatus Saccharimonadales bacterium]|nr:glycine--tRNA ligase [Candidatus Saccharimonadales bacterium]
MNTYDQIIQLALERGFYFPSSELYADASAGFWEYGPNGVKIKNKFLDLWRRELVRRDNMLEIDGSQIMSKSVFAASGHLSNFTDPVVKCRKCLSSFRADKLIQEVAHVEVPERLANEFVDRLVKEHGIICPLCKGDLSHAERFNMMFRIEIGPNHDEAFLRPETCQSIFVDFSRIFKISRGKLPLGIAQVGKSFRNEISPRQGLLRLREFYQAEIEVFCNPSKLDDLNKFDAIKNTILRFYDKQITEISVQEALDRKVLPNKLIGYYLALLVEFFEKTGIDKKRTRLRKLSDEEKAFYSTVAFDFEVDTSIGWLELVACNYRADYDLKSHSTTSKTNLEVMDDEAKVLPHIFELSLGVDRCIYSIMEHSYFVDRENDDRSVLKLKPYLSPIHAGVLPLLKKPGFKEKSSKLLAQIQKDFDVFYDEAGSIGRRYRRLEEIGTPFAFTIDHQTLEDDTVTVRYRDSMKQERIKIDNVNSFLFGNVFTYEKM